MTMTRFGTHATRAAIAVVVLAIAGCAATTEQSGGSSVNVLGSWRYTAQQTSGPARTWSGMLSIDHQGTSTFSGGLDALVRDQFGGQTQSSGVVTGRVLKGSGVDFDVQEIDDTRRHVASVTGDTMRGSWTNTDQTEVGSFVAVRSR